MWRVAHGCCGHIGGPSPAFDAGWWWLLGMPGVVVAHRPYQQVAASFCEDLAADARCVRSRRRAPAISVAHHQPSAQVGGERLECPEQQSPTGHFSRLPPNFCEDLAAVARCVCSCRRVPAIPAVHHRLLPGAGCKRPICPSSVQGTGHSGNSPPSRAETWWQVATAPLAARCPSAPALLPHRLALSQANAAGYRVITAPARNWQKALPRLVKIVLSGGESALRGLHRHIGALQSHELFWELALRKWAVPRGPRLRGILTHARGGVLFSTLLKNSAGVAARQPAILV